MSSRAELRVQETFCAGGDIKGWGCSQDELGNGGFCAGLHFKSHNMGFRNSGLSYKLQGCFFIIRAPVLGPLFVASCPAADLSLQPARLGPSKNPPGVSPLRVLNALYRVSSGFSILWDTLQARIPCVVGVSQDTQLQDSLCQRHPQHTHSMSPDSLWCETPHVPSCRAESSYSMRSLITRITCFSQ